MKACAECFKNVYIFYGITSDVNVYVLLMHVSFGKKVLQCWLHEFVRKRYRSTEVDGANSSKWDL